MKPEIRNAGWVGGFALATIAHSTRENVANIDSAGL